MRTGDKVGFGVGPNLSKSEKQMPAAVGNEPYCPVTKVQPPIDHDRSYPVISFLGTSSAVPNMYRNGKLKNKAC